ncbi:hypothetical protein KCP77_07420 [Salmonella enterica subsp. enterica]|nr:hypothetical protein KCP77_07420 [Salmonella enterica subsp. enterica]
MILFEVRVCAIRFWRHFTRPGPVLGLRFSLRLFAVGGVIKRVYMSEEN